MQHLDQEQPAQAIECNDSDKVVDRRDERTGSNRRSDVELFEEQRNAGADGTGNQHCQQQCDADAGGNGKCEHHGLSRELEDEKSDDSKGQNTKQKTIAETDAHFLENKL